MRYRISYDKKQAIKGTVQLPSSKSISNRLLILDAICGYKCKIENLSSANDTVLLKRLLSEDSSKVLNAEDAGTTFRFLLTFLALKEGKWKITGSERLFERPVKPLIDALSELGAELKYNKKTRIVEIQGGSLQGGKVKLAGNISSQFISSLLLCAAAMPEGLQLSISDEIVSAPYIDMTLQLLSKAGIIYEQHGKIITIEHQHTHPFKIKVENDWSSAAFIYQLAALQSSSAVKMTGLEKSSVQGDALVAYLMKSLGVSTTFIKDTALIKPVKIKEQERLTFYCSDFPDMVPALVVVCAAKGIKAEFHGIGHLRDKESDRIASLRQNLEPYDIGFKEHKDKFIVSGKLTSDKYKFDSFNDHRMAMSMAPLALISKEVVINHPEVVKKSFPAYWEEMKKVGFNIKEIL